MCLFIDYFWKIVKNGKCEIVPSFNNAVETFIVLLLPYNGLWTPWQDCVISTAQFWYIKYEMLPKYGCKRRRDVRVFLKKLGTNKGLLQISKWRFNLV